MLDAGRPVTMRGRFWYMQSAVARLDTVLGIGGDTLLSVAQITTSA